MDPVSLAIVAAITAGVTKGVDWLGNGVVDAYQGLKSLLKAKFGGESELIKAVDSLEQKPTSVARRQVLEEELADAAPEGDSEILEAAQALLGLLGSTPKGEAHVQQAIGSNIAQADHGSYATVTVHQPEDRRQ